MDEKSLKQERLIIETNLARLQSYDWIRMLRRESFRSEGPESVYRVYACIQKKTGEILLISPEVLVPEEGFSLPLLVKKNRIEGGKFRPEPVWDGIYVTEEVRNIVAESLNRYSG